jgi:chemotaxis response regulator CheB
MSRRRVVVLARAGAARERTEAAVQQAGAEWVATLDPVTADEAAVRELRVETVLLVLDPVVESVLGKFDGLLADPALDVMFDESEVAAKREGWEAARWARHLAAKLQGHDDVLPAAPDAVPSFSQEMTEITLKLAELPALQAETGKPPEQSMGAVVIAAGVGGPDAVRQILSSLPAGFPQPLLLRQAIAGGQYDRLVRQMQRATALEVVLAQHGERLRTGVVHVLPDGLDVQEAPQGAVFVTCEEEPKFAALRPADSAMLLLSGAATSLVDAALAMRWAGGLVFGQAVENCFDPAASQLLVARGGEARSLTIMSTQLLQRWPV